MAVDIESTLEHKVTELRKHNPVKGMSARLLRTYCLIHAKYEFSFAYGETCPSPALPPFPKRFYFRRFGLENLPLTLLTLVLTRVLERKAYCNSWLAMQLNNGKVNRSFWDLDDTNWSLSKILVPTLASSFPSVYLWWWTSCATFVKSCPFMPSAKIQKRTATLVNAKDSCLRTADF